MHKEGSATYQPQVLDIGVGAQHALGGLHLRARRIGLFWPVPSMRNGEDLIAELVLAALGR